MTRQQFSRLRVVAAEILRLHGLGAPVETSVLDWATEIAKLKQQPAVRPAPNQEAIYKALDEAPQEGLTSTQLAAQTSIKPLLMSASLCHMVKVGHISIIKILGRSRYFRNAQRMAEGEPLVRAEEAGRAKPEKPPRIPKPPKPSREPKMKEPKAAKPEKYRWGAIPGTPKGKSASLPPRAAPSPSVAIKLSAFIPAHVKVQVLPSGRDTRYEADGSGGAGFSDEWRRLRAPKD